MQNSRQRRQRGESSRPKSLFEVYGRSRNRNSGAVVQKANVE